MSLRIANGYLFTNNKARPIVINFHLITKIFLFQKMHLKTLPSLKKRTKFLRQQVLIWSWRPSPNTDRWQNVVMIIINTDFDNMSTASISRRRRKLAATNRRTDVVHQQDCSTTRRSDQVSKNLVFLWQMKRYMICKDMQIWTWSVK